MKKLVQYGEKNYFLNLGEFEFSPIIKVTSTIALEYSELISKKKESVPFFFCFPEKKSASLWLSLSLLLNNFYDDHFKNVLDGEVFSKGNKVKIFNSIAEVERVTEEKILLRFKDQGGIPINSRLRPQLSHVKSTRSLNNKSLFIRNYKKAKLERNTISKILEPNDSILINQENLKSKILLITGRGVLNSFRRLLVEKKYKEESFSSLFPLDKNLILKPTLESYKVFFEKGSEANVVDFSNRIIKVISKIELEELKQRLSDLLELLKNEKAISPSIDDFFQTIMEDFEDIEGKLKYLQKGYPGLQEGLSKDLKAVIINDIKQFQDYPDTINGFLHSGIPVIVISSRTIERVNEFDYYSSIFDNKNGANYFRFNWNKKKIKALGKITEEKLIDNDLWLICIRYLNQKINIKLFEDNSLDKLIPEIQKVIRDLNEYELLQRGFYKYFYPALYALKNSEKGNSIIVGLIGEFNQIFVEVENIVPNSEFIRLVINKSLEYKDNTKYYSPSENVFCQQLDYKDRNGLCIPNNINKPNLPSVITQKMIFTGYPFNEYSGLFLINAINKFFIPELEILCCPKESELTYEYIKRRLLAGYFTDNIPFILNKKILNKDTILKSENCFEIEILSYLHLERNYLVGVTNKEEENDINSFFNSFKYREYTRKNSAQSGYTVKCQVINFDDGSFMFLPMGSKVLAEVDTLHSEWGVKRMKFKELSVGARVFKYQKDISAYRDIAKSNTVVKEAFEKLNIWRDALDAIYIKHGEKISEIENVLCSIKEELKLEKSSPTKNNIKRWLFDDEIVCPDIENIKVILHAAKYTEVDAIIKKLHKAYKIIVSFTIGLSSKIKKTIIKQLVIMQKNNHNNFNIAISGIKIEVESRVITGFEDELLEADYQNTRKILC